jgi:hypothetical protein
MQPEQDNVVVVVWVIKFIVRTTGRRKLIGGAASKVMKRSELRQLSAFNVARSI